MRPVDLRPAQPVEPAFELVAGETTVPVCEQARRLLAAHFENRSRPGVNGGPNLSQIALVDWVATHEKPVILPTGVQWQWTDSGDASLIGAGSWITARIDLDIYNPAEESAAEGTLQWSTAASAWHGHPQPIEVHQVAQDHVDTVTTVAPGKPRQDRSRFEPADPPRLHRRGSRPHRRLRVRAAGRHLRTARPTNFARRRSQRLERRRRDPVSIAASKNDRSARQSVAEPPPVAD